jgi:hypothetical protein
MDRRINFVGVSHERGSAAEERLTEGGTMKRIHIATEVFAALSGLALLLSSPMLVDAQTTTNSFGGSKFNPPPFDFNDAFYTANGINVRKLDTPAAGRFGLFRQTGPPAHDGQFNWVFDNSNTDPDRKNVRILATTAGYIDDGTGAANQFISLIAFVLDQSFFTGVANARGIQMLDIVGDFEAYAALKQRKPDGTFLTQPCLASLGQTTNCFPVNSVATPNLRQDWRFATNRSGIDGSSGQGFGYFCDDILGMWIITYFYYTADAVGPHPTALCKTVLNNLLAKNGASLDGTPIIKTADELNNDLEGNGCGAEFQLDQGGADGGPVWLICPAMPDPRNGAIAPDAFLDTVLKPNGQPVDPQFTANFNCLKFTGRFCNEPPQTITTRQPVTGGQ